jgi:hypothetical protein
MSFFIYLAGFSLIGALVALLLARLLGLGRGAGATIAILPYLAYALYQGFVMMTGSSSRGGAMPQWLADGALSLAVGLGSLVLYLILSGLFGAKSK